MFKRFKKLHMYEYLFHPTVYINIWNETFYLIFKKRFALLLNKLAFYME